MRRRWSIGVLLLLAGCADPSGDTVTVFAAASLRDALVEAADRYQSAHSTRVLVVSAGSQVLRRQIEAGAPASVFAPASPDHVEPASIAARLEPPRILACNRPVIVTRGDVRDLRSLDRAERLVLGTPEVPIGAYAERILASAGATYGEAWRRRIEARVVTRELDVRHVLSKVTIGEADTAIVYESDALALGGDLRVIEIPDAHAVIARYPIALVRGGPALEPARRFVAWLASDEGLAILDGHGLRRCPDAPEGGGR